MIFSVPKLGKYVLNKEFKLTPGGFHQNFYPLQRMIWRGYIADVALKKMYNNNGDYVARPQTITLPAGTIFNLKNLRITPSITKITIGIPAKDNPMLRNKPDVEGFFATNFGVVPPYIPTHNISYISKYIISGGFIIYCDEKALNGIDCEEYDGALGKSSVV